MGEHLEVQSEIYEEVEFNKTNILSNKNSLLILKFPRNANIEDKVYEDEDGDLLLQRKQFSTIEVECSPSTSLDLVGLQLWRGAFLLADFILSDPTIFDGKVILELGSGIGLTSIVAGIYAKEVICTDLDAGGILDLIRSNINRNEKLMKANFSVLPLDFYAEELPKELGERLGSIDIILAADDFYAEELPKELDERLGSIDIILAADVVYDNDLTEAFIDTLIKLLDSHGNKKFYLALEKRYVFTVADLDTVAPCYEHFLSIFQKKSRRSPMAAWQIREVPLDFKQSFKYERTRHLVMWEIIT